MKRKGFAIHIGVNELNPACYMGDRGILGACEADALAMADLSRALGYDRQVVLLSEDALLADFRRMLAEAMAFLEAGDLLFLSFSGHGFRRFDDTGEEADQWDESWCFYDGLLFDDELSMIWRSFRPGVRLVVVADCCFAGGIHKLFGPHHRFLKQSWPLEIKDERVDSMHSGQQKINFPVLGRLLGGTREYQRAEGGRAFSKFTRALLAVWDEGRFSGGYEDFYVSICRKMSYSQVPVHILFGVRDRVFDAMRPFVI